MYTIVTESSFDSAHFLLGYNGKCKNIHGHCWKVKVELLGENLQLNGHNRGMLVDFKDIKKELRNLTDYLDHSLIIEKNSLKSHILKILKNEGFKILEFDFRPTAENFCKFIYNYLKNKNFKVYEVSVYETETNVAKYREV